VASSIAVWLINATQKVITDKYTAQDDQKKDLMQTLAEIRAEAKAEGKVEMFRLAIKSGATNEVLTAMAAKSGISPRLVSELIRTELS